jgi:hypothetical protein
MEIMKTQTIYAIAEDNGSFTREYTDLDEFNNAKNFNDKTGVIYNTIQYEENVSELQIDEKNKYIVDSASDLSLMGMTNSSSYNLRLVKDGADAVETTIEVIVVDNKIVSEKWRVRTLDSDTAELKEPFTYKAKGKFRTKLNELVLD